MLSPNFSRLTERFLFRFVHTQQRLPCFCIHAGNKVSQLRGIGIHKDEHLTSIHYFSEGFSQSLIQSMTGTDQSKVGKGLGEVAIRFP